MPNKNPNKSPDLPVSCASCSHYPVCFICRDIVDVVSGAPVQFAANDLNNKALYAEIYKVFAMNCNQFKKV